MIYKIITSIHYILLSLIGKIAMSYLARFQIAISMHFYEKPVGNLKPLAGLRLCHGNKNHPYNRGKKRNSF